MNDSDDLSKWRNCPFEFALARELATLNTDTAKSSKMKMWLQRIILASSSVRCRTRAASDVNDRASTKPPVQLTKSSSGYSSVFELSDSRYDICINVSMSTKGKGTL
jgi:hypothetical protein